MTDLPFTYGDETPALVATPRKCSHPKEQRIARITTLGRTWQCGRCHHVADPARISMGRRNRSRGNAKERDAVRASGARRTGQFGGKDDGLSDDGRFAYQSKSLVTARFPGWMWRELLELQRAKPALVAVLVVPESPGPGRPVRTLAVLDKRDWDRLIGGGLL